MTNRLLWMLGTIAVFLLVTVGAALAYNISGTIQNNTDNGTSRVYVVVTFPDGMGTTNFGTSIASIPAGGSSGFTIHGVPSGSYQVSAFMDVNDTGSLHINDPANSSANFSLDDDQSIGTLPLAAVSSTTAPTAVGQVNVVTTTHGALVVWKGPKSPYGGGGPDAELADSYTLYWGTHANPGNGSTPLGSKTVSASGSDYHVFINGLTQGASLYFAVKSLNGKGSAYTATAATSTIVAQAGNATVTGRVYSAGIAKSASTPLYIALQGNTSGGFYIVAVPSPADTQGWTITGVQPDAYNMYVILDLPNDGFSSVSGYATGPGVNTGKSTPTVTVRPGASAALAPDITLTSANSNSTVLTQNMNNSLYYLQVSVSSGTKRPVSVIVNSGPNLSGPIDLGISLGNNSGARFGDNGSLAEFPVRPVVGDSYSVTVGYADNSSETLNPQVTGVVTNLPTPIFPVGTTTGISTNSSLFAWQSPVPLLVGYYDYTFWINATESSSDSVWSPNNHGSMPATQLSVLYNSDNSASQPSLTSGTYNWMMNVNDGFGNQGISSVEFTPQNSGPVISGFVLTSGSGGTGSGVTISGSGFTGTTAVSFGGVSTGFTAQDDSTITTTVPLGATNGPITVTAGGVTTASSTPFPATFTFTGGVQNNGGTAISGATVTLVNSDPVVSATTNGSGNFTITVPSGIPYSFLIHDGVHRDSLTHIMENISNQDSSSTPYKLFLDAELPSSVADKGLIYTRVKDWDTGANLAGATVTATSFRHPGTPYAVSYPGGGTATAADGLFYVPNVDEGDYAAVTATLAGYFVAPRTYVTHTGVVSLGKVNATPLPVVTATPPGGAILPSTSIALAVSNPVGGASYTIWYTTDGSNPTLSDGSRAQYSSPIILPLGDQTLKFYAVNTSRNIAGSVVTAWYSVSAVDPAILPGVPGIGTVTRGSTQVAVNFSAPASDGGSPISSYTVISNPGGKTAIGTASPLTVMGLTNGVAYTFTVKATNGNGIGPASNPSASVTPATLPGKPAIGTATAGSGQASVAFTAPDSNGGSPVTSYTATSSPGGFTASGPASPIAVPVPANGTAYSFIVTATNAVGTGPSSDSSNSVVPISPFTWTVKPAAANPSYKGGHGKIAFTVAGNEATADVYVSSSDPWLLIVAPATVSLTSGKGGGKVSWIVLPNPASTIRSATITIGTQSVLITQAAAPCVAKLTPTKIVATVTGGPATIAVTAPEACGWTVSSGTATWITPDPLSGIASGTISLDIAANDTGKSRSGKITVTTAVKSVSTTVKQTD